MANYSCNLGYRLVPENNARLCQANGAWSGMDPMCQRMSLYLHTYLLFTVNSADCCIPNLFWIRYLIWLQIFDQIINFQELLILKSCIFTAMQLKI